MGFFDAPDPPVQIGGREYSSKDHFNTYNNWVNQVAQETGTTLSDRGRADLIGQLDSGMIKGWDNLTNAVTSYTEPSAGGVHVPGHASTMANEFALFQEYAPQTAELMFNLYNKYTPKIMQTQQSAIESLYPETSALKEQLSKQTAEQLEAGPTALPTEISDFYKRQVREAQSDRGFLNAPGSGRAEAEGIVQLATDFYNTAANRALQLDASLPQISVPSGQGVINNDYFNSLLSSTQTQQSLNTAYEEPEHDYFQFQGYGEQEASPFSQVMGGVVGAATSFLPGMGSFFGGGGGGTPTGAITTNPISNVFGGGSNVFSDLF